MQKSRDQLADEFIAASAVARTLELIESEFTVIRQRASQSQKE